MNFCNQCGNINYIKKNENNKLEYYCKNCNNISEYDNTNGSVYSNKLNNDFYIYNITKNPNIIKDPTLPILNNIKCINKNCIINNYVENSIIIYNTDETIINNIHNKFKDILEKPNKLDNKYLIEFKSDDKYNKEYNKVKSYCKEKKVDIEKNIKKIDEVKFVKYHQDDMKYLYICNYCNSSWKNN